MVCILVVLSGSSTPSFTLIRGRAYRMKDHPQLPSRYHTTTSVQTVVKIAPTRANLWIGHTLLQSNTSPYCLSAALACRCLPKIARCTLAISLSGCNPTHFCLVTTGASQSCSSTSELSPSTAPAPNTTRSFPSRHLSNSIVASEELGGNHMGRR